jgi:predicted TIM-barrel fold metal-dependent hydrolase
MIIDAQVHPHNDGGTMSWTTRLPGPGLLAVDGNQMVAAMDTVGVDRAICVSPWGIYRTDTAFAESVYRDCPDRFRLVAPIAPATNGVADRVAEWAETPGAVGIRFLSLPDHVFEADDPGVAAAVSASVGAGMPINVHCWGRISLVDELARLYPGAQFIVDHLGLTQPLVPPAPPDVFKDLSDVLALARYPNIAMKITGACTYSRRPFPFDDLWEPVGQLIDHFGVGRCMWGTDWTRTTNILGYTEGVSAFRDHWPISESEKAALMGGTAMRIYNWPNPVV